MKKITLFLFALFTCWQINAQVANYAFSQSSGTYTPITGGTVLGTTTSDDQRFVDPAVLTGGTTTTGVGFPIGFNFTFNEIVFDRVAINNNGWISLGQSSLTPSVNNASTSAYEPLTSAAAITPTLLRSRIAGIGDDLQAQTGSELRIETIGSAPNRVFVVQWTNYREYGTTGQNLNFQIRLNETSNIIEVVYGTMVFTSNAEAAQIGLGGSTNTDFNNRTTTTDWNATTAGITNTSSATYSTTVTPPISGLTFVWTPPVPCAGTPVAGSASPANQTLLAGQASTVLSVTGQTSGVSGLTYQWEESTDGTNWVNAVGGTGATTLSYTPPVFGGSMIMYRLRVTCTVSAETSVSTVATLNPCGALTVPSLETLDVFLPTCWQEADNGDLTAGPTTFLSGAWVVDGFGNQGTTGAARILIDGAVDNDWIISPLYAIPATGYELKFDAAATQSGGTGAPTTPWESDDFVEVLVSTGMTNWTVLYTYNAANANIPLNTGTPNVIDLDAYAGQNIRFAFRAVEGAANGAAAIDFSIDNIQVRLTPPCVEPTTLTATNITSNGADLSWVDPTGTQFDYELVVQLAGGGVPTVAGDIVDITTLPLTVNTLNPNTNYEFWVRANCGVDGNSAWVGPVPFRTLCAVFVAPFNQPFATNTFPSCWSQTGPTAWEFGSNVSTPAGFADYGADLAPDFNAAGGTFIGMDGSDNTDGEVSSLLTPFIDVTPLTTPRLKYAVFGNNVDDAARNLLQVEVWDGAAWNLVNTVSDNLGPNWVVFTTDLSTLTITGPIQIRFTVTGVANGGSTFYHDILIDDVTVEETPVTPPSCASNVVATPHPTCGNFNNTISWDAVSGADGYNLTIGTTSGGNDVLNNQNIGSSISYVFAGTVNTTYYYTVIPYNANGPAVGCIEQTFTTNANGCYCVPTYTNGGVGDNITNVVIGSWSNASTGNVLPYYEDFTSQQPAPIAIPTMTAGLNSTVAVTMGTDGTQFSRVWIDFNQNLTFEPSESFSLGTSAGGSGTSNIIVNVPAGATLGVTRMRIRGGDDSAILDTQACGASSSTYGQTEDYLVNILPAPSCLPPTALNATAVTSSSASLGWTEAGTASSWDIEWGTLGFTPTGTPTISGATNPQSISGLNSNTTYSFYVRANCGAGGFSTWSGPFSFTTACVAENVPYSQDFETATVPNLPSCTSQQNVGSGNLWTVENNPGYGFTNKALRYRWNSSNNANVWFYTNGVNLVAGTTYRISYSYGGTGTTFPEKLKVSYGSSANAAAMTNLLADYPNVVNDTPINTFVDFTPSTSGVYYFGFNAYSDADQFYLIVDNILVDVALSSGSFDNANFSAYPNPVKDVLNVSYSTEISSIRVINMIGQEVIFKNINATSTQVDMSQLSAGTYIVNVTVGDNVKTLKVVKQ